MLSVGDLIDINYIPSESDISLKLLVDFYEDYLCKRIFIFTLKDGQVVKLFFRDATELFHVSGIDHIYEGIPMDGSRFVQEIKDGNINLTTVKNVNTAAYKDYEIRIRSMACIDTIIKNCEYLWYPSGRIPDSQIEVKYLLLKGLDNKNLHLGIDTYKINRPYFTRTLLITEGDNAGKFIGKADDRLKVAKLEIRDKDTNQLLILIERELAEKTAFEKVKNYSEEWCSKELPVLLKQHLFEQAQNKILNALIQNINMDWMERVCLLDEDKNSDFLAECECILKECVCKADKKSWNLACRSYIKQNKSAIKDEVRILDSYWVGKIVGEAIRKYEKEELNLSLQMYIDDYIAMHLVDIVTEVFTQKISTLLELNAELEKGYVDMVEGRTVSAKKAFADIRNDMIHKEPVKNMLEVKFYEQVADELLKFAVIISRTENQWVFCKHKERDTYEIPGGRREEGETILETAKRELYEETGALKYEIKPICVYSVTGKTRVNEIGDESFGMLYFANIETFENVLHSEMEEVELFDELPKDWTYPLIQPKLIEEAQRRGIV